jgi:hypothetical protein
MPRFVPVICAALAVFFCAATGITEQSLFGTILEDRFYGFFLRSYPLFLFAIAYGAASIVAAATDEPKPHAPTRALTGALALALFLVACLYPTFGGVVLRSGYAVGSMSALRGQSPGLALVLGAGMAALSFAAVLGLCTAIARLRIRTSRRALARAAASVLALWIGALILECPGWLGFDLLAGFPVRPLGWIRALAVAGVVAAAALPHALVAASFAR